MNPYLKQAGFALSVLVVAALHFGTSFFVSFAAGISPPGSAWQIASKILMFPLLSLGEGMDNLPGILPWLLWAGLSLGWGLLICTLVRRAFKKR